MWPVIIGAVLAIVGVGVAAWAVAGWLREARRAAGAEVRALALRDAEDQLAQALGEVDRVKTQWLDWVVKLQAAGVVRRELADPFALGPDDITSPVAALVDGLPNVPGLDGPTLQAALERMAARVLAGELHPLTRPDMVGGGVLTRTQFDRLRDGLIAGGYLVPGSGRTASPVLTDKGRGLLEAVRSGRLMVQ